MANWCPVGLDPPTLNLLSSLLKKLAEKQAPRLILSLKPDEYIPNWITHMAYVTSQFKLEGIGERENVIEGIHERLLEINKRGQNSEDREAQLARLKMQKKQSSSVLVDDSGAELAEVSRHLKANSGRSYDSSVAHRTRGETLYQRPAPPADAETERRYESHAAFSRDMTGLSSGTDLPPGEPLIEMKGVKVQYGDKAVLGNWKEEHGGTQRNGLWWTVSRGQRWGVFGPNGKAGLRSWIADYTDIF